MEGRQGRTLGSSAGMADGKCLEDKTAPPVAPLRQKMLQTKNKLAARRPQFPTGRSSTHSFATRGHGGGLPTRKIGSSTDAARSSWVVCPDPLLFLRGRVMGFPGLGASHPALPRRLAASCLLAMLAAGCSTPHRLPAVPPPDTAIAQPEIPGARFMVGHD